MSRRKEPTIPNELLDQLLVDGDAGAALAQAGLLDSLKKALTERALNAEMDHHLAPLLIWLRWQGGIICRQLSLPE